jgi:iron complex transport system permease protein
LVVFFWEKRNMSCSHDATALYCANFRKKIYLLFGFLVLLAALMILGMASGVYDLSPLKVVRALLGWEAGPAHIVVWSVRFPRLVAALVAGWGLALSGVAMQSILKNPLGSPFTLGVSHGAAFGAAFAIVVLGAGQVQSGALRTSATTLLTAQNLYLISFFAFLGAMITTGVILFLARVKKMAPEAIILAGVALSSLFVSGTILVQYFASEVELAAVVFWTFGDVSRTNWQEIAVMTVAALWGTVFFIRHRWNLNALSAGEDTAKGLGVEVEKLRLWGMFMAALVSSLVVAFLGVIAFLGLLAPHIARRLVGADHRLLIPHACVIGAILLVLADTCGRLVVGSGTLPVGVLTSFMGAPLFLYLLAGGKKK